MIGKASGQMIHHQPQPAAGAQILMQCKPHLQRGADLAGKNWHQLGRSACDAMLDETDAVSGTDRGKLGQVIIGP